MPRPEKATVSKNSFSDKKNQIVFPQWVKINLFFAQSEIVEKNLNEDFFT